MAIETLIEQLKSVPDWRRVRKVQHPLWLMVLMSLLGVMSGYSSLRGLADFMKRHQQAVADHFGLEKAELPKYSSIRRMMQQVDPEQVVRVFQQWAQSEALPPGKAIAIDGKALASTVREHDTAKQDFVSVVSACLQEYGWVIGQVSFHNSETSEIEKVRQLLKHLDVKGAWFTLDALHCQKNGGSNRGKPEQLLHWSQSESAQSA